MAATVYYTEKTYMEQDYGLVTERLVVSDEYPALYTAGTSCNMMNLKRSKKDFSPDSSSYMQDEMEFTLNEASIESSADAACFSFILAAQTVGVQRFIALFLNPVTTGEVTTAEFVGVISPEMEGTDLVWENKTEYDPEIKPIREWSVKARTFDVAYFDQHEMDDLIHNADDGLITHTSWISDNIADRLGWWKKASTNRAAMFANLVNFNSFLTEISSIVAQRISYAIADTFSIVIDSCTLDAKFSPARFYNQCAAYYQNPNINDYVTRYVGGATISNPNEAPFGKAFTPYLFRINAGDAKTLKLGDGTSDAESPTISKHLFFYKDVESEDACPADKSNSFCNLSFADFIIAIALNLGLYVKFYYTATTELHIQYLNRKNFSSKFVYIPDVIESSIQVSPVFSDDNEKFAGVACQYAKEESPKFTSQSGEVWISGDYVFQGNYRHTISNDYKSGYSSQNAKAGQSEGKKLLLTVSPTVRLQNAGQDSGSESSAEQSALRYLQNVYMPHNGVFSNNFSALERKTDSKRTASLWNAIGLHTAIYLQFTGEESLGTETVDGNSLPVYYGYGIDGETVYAPAGMIHVNVNGTAYHFFSMSDYLNFIQTVDKLSYENIYQMEVPYLCRFRRAEDGTDTDDDGGRGRWQNLALGDKVIIEENSNTNYYIVVGIERDFERVTTKIKLWNKMYQSFADASGLSTAVSRSNTDQPAGIVLNPGHEPGIVSGEDITAGNIVIKNDDGTFTKAKALSSLSCGKLYGMALTSGTEDGEILVVKAGGEGSVSTFNFTANTPLYLRTATTSADNVSASILSAKSLIEDMAVLIGFGNKSLVQLVDFSNLSNQLILTS